MKDTPNYYVTIILAASPAGWIGVHHFYVGNTRRGIFYFLFVLTLLPTIFAIIDSLILIYRGRESFIRKHGTDKDLEEYHLNELQKHNPLAAQQFMQNRDQYSTEEIENAKQESGFNGQNDQVNEKEDEIDEQNKSP